MVENTSARPEFGGLDAYRAFARDVRHGRRYVWNPKVTGFLATVRATIRDRDRALRKGMVLYRAQIGIEWLENFDDDGNEVGEDPVGFGFKRMSPRANQATEGRANAAGVSVLYLASEEETAVAEVGPWIGSAVSLAQFKIGRDLKALDLSVRHGQSSLNLKYILGEETPDAVAKEKAIWTDIDDAFSRPVSRSDDGGDYAPTQILAELFRYAGYDAIVFRSQFGKKGYNLVLFDIADAEPINCAPCEVTAIKVKFKEIGNRWFSTKHLEERSGS
jgi:hypothetical protein